MNDYNIVFVSNKNFLFYCVVCKGYLKSNYDINSRIYMVNDNLKKEDLQLKDIDIVIPFTFEGMRFCYGLTNCLVMSPRQIDYLNDKQSCGEFIDMLNVPNIPTFYNHKYDSLSDLNNFTNNFSNESTFCIKGRTTSASRDIKFVSKPELLKKYKDNRKSFDDYIVQLYIESDYILAIDCICYKGEIKGFLINKSPLFFRKEDKFLKNRFKRFTHELVNSRSNNMFYNRVIENTEHIIKKVNYDGFIEIEWLCRENDNKLLFLEINPRMSGNLNYSNYEGGRKVYLPYIDILLLNYVGVIMENKMKNNCEDYKKLKSSIPCKDTFPKKITKGSYNLVFRPFLIILCLIIIVVLISKLDFSKK